MPEHGFARVGQGGPSRGRPGRNPTRPWRWIASSGTLPATAIPTSLTPVSQGAAHVVVLSLCEAAKREFGGFVQRVFRGFTSTIKLGVFEHPTLRTTLTQGEDRTVLDRPNERYHAYRTTQSRRPRPEPAPDLLARSPDSMRQDFSLGGSFKIFGTTILSPFQCIRNTPIYAVRYCVYDTVSYQYTVE